MDVDENSVLTRLKAADRLPAPKGVALEVINLTQRDDVSNHDIVRLISVDPALCARVIKAANVLLSNPSRPIATISDAVTVLGARALRQLVMGIALIVDYRSGPCKQFDYQHFWAHSLLTGIAARHLVARTRLAIPEEIFVLGLLGNIGQLAFATAYPEEYGELLGRASESPVDELCRLEQGEFGCDETELSGAILADMHFPMLFQTLAHDHLLPDSSKLEEGSREWQLLHLLYVASLLADACLARQAQRGGLVAKLRQSAARVGVEGDRLIEIGDACTQDWLDWLDMLGMKMVRIPPFTELLQQPEVADDEIDVPPWIDVGRDHYKMRVLVVDDDRAMLGLLAAMLKAAGHEVLTAHDGVEALRLVEQASPQLVITAWGLPEMDGLELCRKLREDVLRRDVYVFILAPEESPDRLVEAFEAGVDDYLVKPFSQRVFFARLRAAQRVVQLQDELAYDREQLMRFSRDLATSNERLQRLALTDALTELPNRRFAMERLEQEWALSLRGDRALSCMMVDIDHFKAINDRLGHQAGDEVLKSVAHALRQAARTQDQVCRYGGEEFVVICPDTGLDAAVQCAERLRQMVFKLICKSGATNLSLTISIGVAEHRPEMVSVDDLLARADACLYAAKEGGRNRVVSGK
ncbi:MAG TPA: diguanylate cyclase [Gallionella sp.]|nr:diguanylate cyclase [Gallionella sp.]